MHAIPGTRAGYAHPGRGRGHHGGPGRGHGHHEGYRHHRGSRLGAGDRQWMRIKHGLRTARYRIGGTGILGSLAIGAGIGATAGAVLPVLGPISGAVLGAAAGAFMAGGRAVRGLFFGGPRYGHHRRPHTRVIVQPAPMPMPVPVPVPVASTGYGYGPSVMTVPPGMAYHSPGATYNTWF